MRDTVPIPIDSVPRDERAVQFHDLDEIEFVAVRRLAWVFPDQAVSVEREDVRAVRRCVLVESFSRGFLQEAVECDSSLDYSGTQIEQHWDKGAFENRIGRVELRQSGRVAFLDALVPFTKDIGGLLQGCGHVESLCVTGR